MKRCNTTCPYCGVGCGVTAELEQDRVIAVSGDRAHPANAGRLCVKGTALAETLVGDGRLLQPSWRGRDLSWDAALDLLAENLGETRERYGPGSVAFYLSGQLLTEDYYVANKLMKGFLGSGNVDTNSRLCMSSAVSAYKRALGADFVPCTYRDLDDCDLLVMVGSNAAWTHPVVYQRIAAARQRDPRKRVVVIDPRRTATCDLADMHLQINPGSDAFLFAGLLNYLREHDHFDEAFIGATTEGLEPSLAAIAGVDCDSVAAATGLDPALLLDFYRLFAGHDRTVTLYSQGVNQSATGTDKCNAIINCHLATGRIGRAGTGPFSITGQPNAMGGREVGGLANQLAAHMDFDEENIERVQRFWSAPDMARAPGLKAVDMFRAAAEGEIRFLWIMGTNPAVSLPDSALVRRALERCDFVVVSDCMARTDTTAHADLLLPAMGWGEKDGTVTNSERCISRQRRLVPAHGEARQDWWIVSEVARRLGFGEAFDYRGSADIFREHAALSGFENGGSRAFDISALAALDDGEYDQLAPTTWPATAAPPEGAQQREGRFYTPSRRARFVPVTPELPHVPADDATALVLNTGRLRDQWHTMTRTGLVPRLMRHRDFYSISLHPLDAAQAGLRSGDLAALHNRGRRVTGLVHLDDGLAPGQVFSPIHWNRQYSGEACVSELFPPETDPVSGQPQSKFAHVRLEPQASTCWGMLFTRATCDLPPLQYWSRIAVDSGYLVLLAGGGNENAPNLKEALLAAVTMSGVDPVEYCDSAESDYRAIGIANGRVEYALFLHRDRQHLPARGWLADLGTAAPTAGPATLLAGINPSVEDPGRLVCTCWEVGENQICSAIRAGACSVGQLGEKLRCGTQCGSCVPELRQLVEQSREQCVA